MSPTSMRVEDTRSYTPHKIIAKPLDTARVDIIFVQINVEDEVRLPRVMLVDVGNGLA